MIIVSKNPAFVKYLIDKGAASVTNNKVIPVPTSSVSTFFTNLKDFPLTKILFRA